MKRRSSVWMFFSGALCFFMLTGCGLGIADAPETAADPLALGAQMEAAGETEQAIAAYHDAYAQDPRQTDLLRKLIALCTEETDTGRADYAELLIEMYEDLYASEQMTEEEFLALCGWYEAQGESAKMCVALERAQRLSPAPEWQKLLDALVIDTASLPEDTQQKILPVFEAMAALDPDTAVPLLLDGSYFESLRSTVPGGTRRYRSVGDAGELKIETAFDIAGEPVLRIWYLGQSGDAAVIRQSAGTLSITKAGYSGGDYNGAFTSTYYEAATGSIFADAGTFSSNILTGAFSTSACFGAAETTLAALWNGRASAAMVSYTGAFDEAGHATTTQQNNVKSTGVIYAYQADDASKFIYVLDPDALGSAGYVFDYSDVGVDLLAEW